MSGEKVAEAMEVEEKLSGGTESNKSGGGEVKNGLMKWEKFLPRITLRVLLVEADDSTRQIIAALLRKCSYRGQISFSVLVCLIAPNCSFP